MQTIGFNQSPRYKVQLLSGLTEDPSINPLSSVDLHISATYGIYYFIFSVSPILRLLGHDRTTSKNSDKQR